MHFHPNEAHAERALEILAGVGEGSIDLVQPPHFVAEVAAVLAREKPDEASSDLSDLLNLEFQPMESTNIYATATNLSIRLNHHLFDTLYHATAMHIPRSIYVTADVRYYEKAKVLGQIVLLADFDPSHRSKRET